MKKQLLLLLLMAILTGCTTPRLYLNTKEIPEEINFKLNYSIDNEDKIFLMLSEEMNLFIKDYNKHNSMYKIIRNDQAEEKFLSIDVKQIEYVSSGKQVGSTLLTLAGLGVLAYTASNSQKTGFTIFWYWFPKYYMTNVMKLSEDLNNSENTIIKSIGSFHGYQGIESQKEGLCEDFRSLLIETMQDLEKVDVQ